LAVQNGSARKENVGPENSICFRFVDTSGGTARTAQVGGDCRNVGHI